MRLLTPASLRFGVFALDLGRGVLLRDDSEVPLRRQSFEVFRYLAENMGRVVSNDELVRAVWVSKPADPAASVGQCIKEVRRALGGEARWIIRTVSGRGYEFRAQIVRSESAQRDPNEISETGGNSRLQRPQPSASAATTTSYRLQFRWLALAAAGACAALASMYLPGQFASPADRRAALERSAEVAAPSPGAALTDSFFGGRLVTEFFSQSDGQRVADLATSKELPLPSFQMHLPDYRVSADVRRFVGIWVSDTGWTGSNRQYMLIITDADRNGAVSGYHVNGPPQPGSRFQSRAHYSAFRGSVSAASLSIDDSAGQFVASFLGEDRIQIDLTFRDGLIGRVVLNPIWMLVDAERAGVTRDRSGGADALGDRR